MPSERLYYADSYVTGFDAVVRSVERQGDRWVVSLDRTAFYPTSGGQPFDTGTLGEARVLDVVDREDGTIAHLVDRELAVDERLRGTIDWDRRFDHMQQHTGQHLLSAAFVREHGARTVGFHLGASSATIDLDRDLSTEAIAGAELAANRVIWEDRALSVRFATAEEADKLPLRKESVRTGELRLIEIPDYDLSACGGTHVATTGAIGIIAVASSERFKGGVRVEFLCGARALKAHRTLREAVGGSVRLLSVVPDQLPSAIEKLQTEAKGQKKIQQTLQERLAGHEAAGFRARGEQIGRTTLVAEVVSDADASLLKNLASAITAAEGFAAILVSSAAPVLVVISRSEGVALEAGALLKRVTDRFGGRGGGKGTLAQAGGLNGPPHDVLGLAKELAVNELTDHESDGVAGSEAGT